MITRLISLAWGILVFFIEVILWTLSLLRAFVFKLFDYSKARRSFSKGELTCPQGHTIPTEDEIYECTECGFTYTGSIWFCPNPECQATTPYVNCPECRLSVRNPYRWGRP